MVSTRTEATSQNHITTNRLLRLGLIAMIAAAAANALLYLIVVVVLGIPVAVPAQAGGVLTLPAVVIASIVGALGATIAFAGLARFTRRPAHIFRLVALAVLLLSLIGPLTASDVDGTSKLVLAAMHTIAAVASVAALTIPGGRRQA
jgi:hypothetical protein